MYIAIFLSFLMVGSFLFGFYVIPCLLPLHFTEKAKIPQNVGVTKSQSMTDNHYNDQARWCKLWYVYKNGTIIDGSRCSF